MKKMLAFLLLFTAFQVSAQMKEGRVVYERVFQLPVRLFNADPAIAAQIPKSRTDQYELLFGNNKSLWQFLPDANNDGEGSTFSNGNMVVRMPGPSNEVSFVDFASSLRVDQREVAQRSFVVTDSIRKLEWKFTDETKTILNYSARKATAKRIGQRAQISMENGQMKREMIPDTATVIAWFTTDIPVSAGPSEYQGQLPGLILEMDINNGQNVFKAIEISPKVNTNKIKEPKEGKKVTAAQFTAEREKILAEMQKNMPAGGVRIQQ